MLYTLILAIEQRRYIAFTYDSLARIAQPATVGESRAGNTVLRCYQTEGGHITSGHEWNFCEIEKMSDLKILDKTFSSDPVGYKKGDRHMVKIHAEL